MKKFIATITCIISAIVVIWTVASFMEIVCNNLDENPEYSEKNIIIQLVEEAK